jgi:hypothetical protein
MATDRGPRSGATNPPQFLVRQPFGERQTGAVAMPMIAARMFDFDPPRR